MRQPRLRPDRPGVWPLTALSVTYGVAACLHGLLAMRAGAWWLGLLAVALATVAVAFLLVARRRRRKRRLADEEPTARPGAVVVPIMRHRDADPART